MGGGLLDGGEDSGRLHHVLSSCGAPRDGRGVALTIDGDLLAVDDQLVAVNGNLPLVATVGGVVPGENEGKFAIVNSPISRTE